MDRTEYAGACVARGPSTGMPRTAQMSVRQRTVPRLGPQTPAPPSFASAHVCKLQPVNRAVIGLIREAFIVARLFLFETRTFSLVRD